jgi:hypothetical protein
VVEEDEEAILRDKRMDADNMDEDEDEDEYADVGIGIGTAVAIRGEGTTESDDDTLLAYAHRLLTRLIIACIGFDKEVSAIPF